MDKGVKVINVSIYTFAPELDEAFEYARLHDVLLVVGAGNSNREIPVVSWNRENVIVVGAADKNDARWTMMISGIAHGSCWGEMLDVCAPIENIAVTAPSDPRFYRSIDGPTGGEEEEYKGICQLLHYGATSCATPMVTALAALVYSTAPHLTAVEVKQAILAGADDIGDPGVDPYTGHGRINYGKTLSLVNDGWGCPIVE